jgi:hypothetical protein
MPKKTPLSDALAQAAHGAGSAKLVPGAPKQVGAVSGAKPYRAGRVNITGYFDPAVKQSIRLIQSKHPDRTVQELLAEALNDLFAKYNVPQTAELQPSSEVLERQTV